MTQYVDIQYIRNALGITGTKDSCKGCKYNKPSGFACNTYEAPSFAYVCEVLDDAPIVDAMPVIRCKDCKYYQQGRNDWLWCMMNHHYTDDEKYCAWAERKEE